MKNTKKIFILVFLFLASLAFLVSLNTVKAITIDSVDQGTLYPGQDTDISIALKNNFNYDVEDISFQLVFITSTSSSSQALQFSPVGPSEVDIDEIREDKTKTIDFTISSSNSIEPGSYTIPYILSYKTENSTYVTKTGVVGINVNSKTKLDYIVSADTPVIGQKSKLSLKIVNKGFGEVKFVSVELQPSGYTLLSDSKVYIGSISSDDFQTATFNVLFTKANPTFTATITYKDFENLDHTENVDLAFDVYSYDEAVQRQLIQKNNSVYYVIIVVVLLIVWFAWRSYKKRKKKKALLNSTDRR